MAKDLSPTSTAPYGAEIIELTRAVLPALFALRKAAIEQQKTTLNASGKMDEQNQAAAHGLAWLATYVQALHQLQNWADKLSQTDKFGEVEQLLLQIAFGEYLSQILGGIPMSQGEITRLHDIGLTETTFAQPHVTALARSGNSPSARARLAALMAQQRAEITTGAPGTDDEMEMIRVQFHRFAAQKVAPFAHDWHLKDELIPLEIINELADMGVFGLTIPEEYGGFGLPKIAMAVVSEELSRGYIGVGSLGTRSEI
ncbi:MAG: acyl-CoA dehydrogenase family protein, partial [Rhodobacteraceae bacterium]|nr:acyl-CoA dehydrogenase family protein [Paracoccaceae bacterium]